MERKSELRERTIAKRPTQAPSRKHLTQAAGYEEPAGKPNGGRTVKTSDPLWPEVHGKGKKKERIQGEGNGRAGEKEGILLNRHCITKDDAALGINHFSSNEEE